jgi:hypothetical protein
VKRNRERFPEDFMFVLSPAEFAEWRSQFVTSKSDRMGLRHSPMAFTEQGVAMLASVLNSPRAVQVNIEIMRVFVRLREVLDSNRDLARKFTKLEHRVATHDDQIQAIFEAIRQLLNPSKLPLKQIGFQVKEGRAVYRAHGKGEKR